MVEKFANSRDPDHTLHSDASYLGLHYLPITRLGISSLQWVKYIDTLSFLFHLNILTSQFGYSAIYQ